MQDGLNSRKKGAIATDLRLRDSHTPDQGAGSSGEQKSDRQGRHAVLFGPCGMAGEMAGQMAGEVCPFLQVRVAAD